MRPLLILISFLVLNINLACAQPGKSKLPVIFDSDMGPDYDDVGAITMLHAFADSGYINIMATMASTKYEPVGVVMNVFNTYFGRPEIPIGVAGGNALEWKDWQHWTDSVLANYPHKVKKNAELPDALSLYRKLLAASADTSVVIITTGFLSNLRALLQSGPDSYSPLPGKQLVQKKVKRLFCMAGAFPSGREFNVEKDAPASQLVFSEWPTEIILSGFEIGWPVRTGLPLVNNKKIRNSPVQDVFRLCISKSAQDSAGRMSWDETAVLVAIKGFSTWYNLQPGRMIVNSDGSNGWDEKGKGHYYLLQKSSISEVQKTINRLMMHQPVDK